VSGAVNLALGITGKSRGGRETQQFLQAARQIRQQQGFQTSMKASDIQSRHQLEMARHLNWQALTQLTCLLEARTTPKSFHHYQRRREVQATGLETHLLVRLRRCEPM
jgi:hypothetical protein